MTWQLTVFWRLPPERTAPMKLSRAPRLDRPECGLPMRALSSGATPHRRASRGADRFLPAKSSGPRSFRGAPARVAMEGPGASAIGRPGRSGSEPPVAMESLEQRCTAAVPCSAKPTSDPVGGVLQPAGQIVPVRAIDKKAGAIRRIAPDDCGDVRQPHARGLTGVARQRIRIDKA